MRRTTPVERFCTCKAQLCDHATNNESYCLVEPWNVLDYFQDSDILLLTRTTIPRTPIVRSPQTRCSWVHFDRFRSTLSCFLTTRTLCHSGAYFLPLVIVQQSDDASLVHDLAGDHGPEGYYDCQGHSIGMDGAPSTGPYA